MGFRLTFDHNHCGNVFCGLCGVGEAILLWKQRGTHVARGKRERKRVGGWKRITSRDRWCILADSRNPFHAQMKAVWEGECVCSLCTIGVAGQGLGLLAFPRWRREETHHNLDQSSFSSISDRPKGRSQAIVTDFLFSIVHLSLLMRHQNNMLSINIVYREQNTVSFIYCDLVIHMTSQGNRVGFFF